MGLGVNLLEFPICWNLGLPLARNRGLEKPPPSFPAVNEVAAQLTQTTC